MLMVVQHTWHKSQIVTELVYARIMFLCYHVILDIIDFPTFQLDTFVNLIGKQNVTTAFLTFGLSPLLLNSPATVFQWLF